MPACGTRCAHGDFNLVDEGGFDVGVFELCPVDALARRPFGELVLEFPGEPKHEAHCVVVAVFTV